MANVSIASLEKAPVVDLPRGFSGVAETRGLFYRDQNPLHLYVHRLQGNAMLRLGPKDADCMVYIWKGAVSAGGRVLAAGSSLIVEHGAAIDISGSDDTSLLLTFNAARPSRRQRAGGHLHLLPTERVPRVSCLGGTSGVGGGIHADAACPTCAVWLHENSLAPIDADPADADTEKGVHSHTEDEVIFVTDGQMRLGGRLCGPGTAIAIAAETFYSFGVGPDGLKFINFRAALPGEIKFKSGTTMDEVAFWRNQVGTPEYLAPLAAHQPPST